MPQSLTLDDLAQYGAQPPAPPPAAPAQSAAAPAAAAPAAPGALTLDDLAKYGAKPPAWESWTTGDPAKQNIFKSMYDESIADAVQMVGRTAQRNDFGAGEAEQLLWGLHDQAKNFIAHPSWRNAPLVGPGWSSLTDRLGRQYKAQNYQGMAGTAIGLILPFLAPEAGAAMLEKLPAASRAAALAADATGRFTEAAGAGLKAGMEAAAPDITAAAKRGAYATVAGRLPLGPLGSIVEGAADVVSAGQAARGIYRGAKAFRGAYADTRAAQAAARAAETAGATEATAGAADAAAGGATAASQPLWEDAPAAAWASDFATAPDARDTLTPEMQARADEVRTQTHAPGATAAAADAQPGADLTIAPARTPAQKLEDWIDEHTAYRRMQAQDLEWGNRARMADRYAEYFINNKLDPTPENIARATRDMGETKIPGGDETMPMIQERVAWHNARTAVAEAAPEAAAVNPLTTAPAEVGAANASEVGAAPTGAKTKLDLMLDGVKPGQHEVTFDVRDYTEAEKQRVIDAAQARGLDAGTDGKHILVRDLRAAAPEAKSLTEQQLEASIAAVKPKRAAANGANGAAIPSGSVANVELFRGVNAENGKTGNYFTPSQDFAREFTQSGRDSEIRKISIASSDIADFGKKTPFAGSEDEITAAIKKAAASGKKAFYVSEGAGQPRSVFVVNKK